MAIPIRQIRMMTRPRRPDPAKRDGPSPSRVGDMSEIVATLWLLKQGFEVFRNVGSDGPADLVALDRETGAVTKIDVKTRTAYATKNGEVVSWSSGLKNYQLAIGVRLLVADPATGTCFWADEVLP